MDILGSILNSMDKPPTVSEKQKQLMKKQKDEILLKQKQEKERLAKFRESTSRHLSKFVSDSTRTRLKFPPFDQVMRAIVHELSEEAGLTSASFGEEGVDRYILVYKRESPPSEDELACLRRGEEWTRAKAEEMANARKKAEALAAEEEAGKGARAKFTPATDYKEKYQHLIGGLEAAKEAAKATCTNKQYGFVPSENKKDHRSIEETLRDIREKKRRRLNESGGAEAP